MDNMDRLNEYDMYMHSVQQSIITKKVLELGRIFISIGPVTCISSENYQTNDLQCLYFDKPNEVPVTGDTIIGRIKRTYPDVEYILFDGVFIDSNTEFTQQNLAFYMYLINLLNEMKNQTEEFIEYVNYNLNDYLLEMSHEKN